MIQFVLGIICVFAGCRESGGNVGGPESALEQHRKTPLKVGSSPQMVGAETA